jgi:formylglycine-generating enzyme required for sulfatase activity
MRAIRQMLFCMLTGVVCFGAAGARADGTATLTGWYQGNTQNVVSVVLTPTTTQGVYSATWELVLGGGPSYAPGTVIAPDLRNGPVSGTCNTGYFPSGPGWCYFVGAATNGVWSWQAYKSADDFSYGPGMLTVISAPDSSDMTLDLGGGVSMDFMLMQPGTFTMGTTNYANAQPVHSVVLTRPFYMGKYEVTEAQYRQIMGSGNSSSNPVIIPGVPNCTDFTTNLSAKCGVIARLPSEAEWEYSCRAGTTTEYFFGNGEYANGTNMLAQYAWYNANAGGSIHPVGLLKPNPWGLYDIYGNVWEWTLDGVSGGSGYQPEVVQAPGPATNPAQGWLGDGHHIVRSAAYNCSAFQCDSCYRGGGAGYDAHALGIRLVVEVPLTLISVSITSPTNKSVFVAGDDITINATASDTNGTIARVEFYQGATQLGQDTTSPYSLTWNSVAAGTYSLTARAIDNNSFTGTSMWVGITVQPQTNGLPTISNGSGASDVTMVSATFNGNLLSTGTSATVVSLYWGASDAGATTIGWDHVVNFGQCAQGPLSTNVTGLTPGNTYYYRFYATNSIGSIWGSPAAQFKTLAVPVVDNGTGATSITPMSAQLRGTLTVGNSADVTVYWGTTDGGTTASSWQHAIGMGTLNEGSFASDINALSPLTVYYYRCYATNSVGSDWANATASFQSAPTLANGWAYGMKIRFAGYSKSETLTNFPALVVLGTNIAGFTYSQFQSLNGWDLSFAASNQVTPLNYEMGQWNTNGNSYVWVQVPKLSSSNDYIWAYWGNTGAAAAPAACTTNGATWDASCFKGVWHLGEKLTQNQSTGTNYDSTGYANNGLQHNNGWTNGIVGRAQNFDGSSCYINTAASMTNGTMTNFMTLSLWVKVLGPADWGSTMIMLNESNANVSYHFSNQTKQHQSMNLGAADRTGNGLVSTGVWTYLTETYAQAGGYNSISYLNGAYDGTASRVDKPGTAGTWYFGKNAGGGYYYQGAMEEVRVEQVQRSSNWVWACYQTMAANALFTSYEVQSGSTSNTATVHGVPYSWLQSYGITNTSDSIETQHVGESSLTVLQNYIAGMNPTNPNSCFVLNITNSAGQVIVRVPSLQATGPNYTGKTRYYGLEMRTNLLLGAWQPVTGYTNVPGDGSVITCTNAIQDLAKFYRVKVRLQ